MIFLNKNSASVERDVTVLNLFSSLSSRWYPTNIIRSSIYSVLDSYAEQFSSLSIDMSSVFMNYFLSDVRSGEYQSSTYQNFGSLYDLTKSSYQTIEIFSSSSVYTSYKNQLHFISDSTFNSLTVNGLNSVGQSYSGISPLFSTQLKEYTGWRLITTSASIVDEGSRFVMIDRSIPRLGTVIPIDFTDISGSVLYYNRSKLGVNTKIYSKQHYFSGLDSIIYGNQSASVVYDQLLESLKSTVRADVKIYPQYSSVYSYYRPSLNKDEFTVTASASVFLTKDYLINLYSGNFSVTGSVIELPEDCANYEWEYDWSVRTYNKSSYNMYVRWYPSASIPESVYFTQIDSDEELAYLPASLDSPYSYEPFIVIPSQTFTVDDSLTYMVLKINKGTHYILNNQSVLEDISGRMYNLYRDYLTEDDLSYQRARNQNYLTPIVRNQIAAYSGSVGNYQNFDTSFYFEIWVSGVDKNFEDSYIQFKRQESTEGLYEEEILDSNGLGFCINSNHLSFFSSNGSLQSVSCSVLSLREEEPKRWHYFAGTYLSGSVYLYIDGRLAKEEYNLAGLPNVPIGYSSVILSTQGEVSVDEIVLSNGFLSPDLALEHFNMSKPRLSRSSILASGSMYRYHQPMIMMYASSSLEIEWHEFSMRGDHRTPYYLTNRFYLETPYESLLLPA